MSNHDLRGTEIRAAHPLRPATRGFEHRADPLTRCRARLLVTAEQDGARVDLSQSDLEAIVDAVAKDLCHLPRGEESMADQLSTLETLTRGLAAALASTAETIPDLPPGIGSLQRRVEETLVLLALARADRHARGERP